MPDRRARCWLRQALSVVHIAGAKRRAAQFADLMGMARFTALGAASVGPSPVAGSPPISVRKLPGWTARWCGPVLGMSNTGIGPFGRCRRSFTSAQSCGVCNALAAWPPFLNPPAGIPIELLPAPLSWRARRQRQRGCGADVAHHVGVPACLWSVKGLCPTAVTAAESFEKGLRSSTFNQVLPIALASPGLMPLPSARRRAC